MWHHYRLNYSKEFVKRKARAYDVGFVVAGSFGKRHLYGAMYLTNAAFSDARTAAQYLCLTYSPRFRYVPNLAHIKTGPVHITDSNGEVISQRTCPAFGHHGGVGEWIIPTNVMPKGSAIPLVIDHYFLEGGEMDRWYMAAWDRRLLLKLIASTASAYVGYDISVRILGNALNKDVSIEAESEKMEQLHTFWAENYPSVFIIKPSGLVAYTPVYSCKLNDDYQLLAYLAISCGFHVAGNSVYIKLWGALWEDYLKIPPGTTVELPYCDNKLHGTQTIIKKSDFRNCLHHDWLTDLEEVIDSADVCGVRLSGYLVESGDISFYNPFRSNLHRVEFIATLSKLIAGLKQFLVISYKNPSLAWCNASKKMVLLPKLVKTIRI